ncbi:MAG TPA: hypothetical protein DDX40_09710 [Rikenellaceae bacterium]|nr:hypothetical protein [Rikenellaceae bacterium]
MRTITKIFIAAAVALFALPQASFAKSKTLDAFVSKVSASLVSFDYSFTMPTKKAKMTGNGSVKVQGNSFIVDGNGLEIWCDGKTRWTVDRISEEALVESVDDSYDSYATNPALMIASVDKAFRELSFGSAKFGGKVVDASVLSPVSKGKGSMDIAGLKLFFKSGTTNLIGAEVALNDGSVSNFTITNIRFEEAGKSKESFRFNEKTLDSSYVITDLR